MTTETWKPVNGYFGLYEVSSEGRVRSLDRTIITHGGTPYLRRGRILRPQGKKYLHVRLSRAGFIRILRVHRLVCEAFHGPAPEGKPLVLHGNGDPGDNRSLNLRWGTHVENEADKAGHGRNHQSSKDECPQGHLLIYPNLERWNAQKGWRKCLSCGRESALARSQGREFEPGLAHERYKGVMGE